MTGRALVLGGGGSAGHAWLIGVIAGLLDAGLDVTQADVIVGTSAGATAAVQLSSGVPPSVLLAGIVAEPVQSSTTQAPSGSAHVRRGVGVDHRERTGRIIAAAADPADMRRTLGSAAIELAAMTDGTGSLRWRATVAARLPIQQWPTRRLLITAVDAQGGEPVVFDQHSGVDLVDAVAASTSSGPAYRIGDRQYIDGGYRRNENADLATGHARVLVLSPLGGRTRHPLEWGTHLAAQVDELQASGSDVQTILPGSRSLDALGTNLMDLTARPPAARAGHEQGRLRAPQLTGFWH